MSNLSNVSESICQLRPSFWHQTLHDSDKKKYILAEKCAWQTDTDIVSLPKVGKTPGKLVAPIGHYGERAGASYLIPDCSLFLSLGCLSSWHFGIRTTRSANGGYLLIDSYLIERRFWYDRFMFLDSPWRT